MPRLSSTNRSAVQKISSGQTLIENVDLRSSLPSTKQPNILLEISVDDDVPSSRVAKKKKINSERIVEINHILTTYAFTVSQPWKIVFQPLGMALRLTMV